MALGWVSKYLKDTFFIKTLVYENPNNVAMPLSNSLLQIVPFHELAISIGPMLTFFFQR
jgi:hypothetical protein